MSNNREYLNFSKSTNWDYTKTSMCPASVRYWMGLVWSMCKLRLLVWGMDACALSVIRQFNMSINTSGIWNIVQKADQNAHHPNSKAYVSFNTLCQLYEWNTYHQPCLQHTHWSVTQCEAANSEWVTLNLISKSWNTHYAHDMTCTMSILYKYAYRQCQVLMQKQGDL